MRAKKYVLTALCLTLLCFGAVGISSAAEPQTHKNGIGMEFVLIPAGSFLGEEVRWKNGERITDVRPKVIISKPFYLGEYEVTQAQWEAVMGVIRHNSRDVIILWSRYPGMTRRSSFGV